MCWMLFVATSIRKSVASTVEHCLDLGVKLQDHQHRLGDWQTLQKHHLPTAVDGKVLHHHQSRGGHPEAFHLSCGRASSRDGRGQGVLA